MAHGIYTNRDFQISEEMAWHKKTTIAKPVITAFPTIQAMPLFYGDDCKSAAHGDNAYYMPVSTDDMLPVAPPFNPQSYSLFTPQDAWKWVSEVLEGTGHDFKSIGMLWNRSFWFIGVELSELKNLTIGDGRESRFQMNFSGGLDRKVSPQCELSSILPVCWNTISLSRSSGQVLFREKATKNFSNRLEAAKSEIEKAVGMTRVFKAAMDGLAKKPCNVDRARCVFAGYLTPGDDKKMSTRTKNTVDTLADLHVNGIANRGKTEFDMLNAYTQLLSRGTESSTVDTGARFTSSEFGGNADGKADFTRLLTTGRDTLFATEQRGKELVFGN